MTKETKPTTPSSGEQPVPKVMQRPNGCWAACIATLTGISLDEFPPLPDEARDESWWDENGTRLTNEITAVLHRRGWRKYSTWSDVPRGFAMAYGTSPRGHQHAVVVKDGKLWHDPHPEGGGVRDVQQYEVLVPILRSPRWASREERAALVAKLREKVDHGEHDGWHLDPLHVAAADAIEALAIESSTWFAQYEAWRKRGMEAESTLAAVEGERDAARAEIARIARHSVEFADALVAERTAALTERLEAANGAGTTEQSAYREVEWLSSHLSDPEDQREYAREKAAAAISSTIERAMKAAQMTKGALAKKLGWNPSQVTRSLRATHNLTVKSIGELLWACGWEVEDFDRALTPLGVVRVAVPAESQIRTTLFGGGNQDP